jgi:hypothetical protein
MCGSLNSTLRTILAGLHVSDPDGFPSRGILSVVGFIANYRSQPERCKVTQTRTSKRTNTATSVTGLRGYPKRVPPGMAGVYVARGSERYRDISTVSVWVNRRHWLGQATAWLSLDTLRREIHAPQQILEARVITQIVESRVYLKPDKIHSLLRVGFL